MEVAETLAPYVFTTHIKDMAVAMDARVLLMSEVPLGRGMLDLRSMVALCLQHNPGIRFHLEMITRDPLPIPVFTDKYWAAMPTVPGRDLAHTLRTLRDTKWSQPLPRYGQRSPDQQLKAEDENVKRCLAYAVEKLNL
jgi:hypothetical protein